MQTNFTSRRLSFKPMTPFRFGLFIIAILLFAQAQANWVQKGESSSNPVSTHPLSNGSNENISNIPHNNQFRGYIGLPVIQVSGGSPLMVIADGDTSPSISDGTDFGSTATSGSTISKFFRIKNTGHDILILGPNAVTISGSSDFTVTVQPDVTVGINATTHFIIQYDPVNCSASNATVQINSNDSSHNPFDFAITGLGAPDNTAPDFGCLSVEGVQLPFGTVSGFDYLIWFEDNCTVPSNLQSRIRIAGTGTGAPAPGEEMLTFDCSQLGFQYVEVWVGDEAGNWNYCTVQVLVQDFGGGCTTSTTLSGNIHMETGSPISNVIVTITGATNGFTATTMTDMNGDYSFPNVPDNDTYTVCCDKNTDPLNGVSTFDGVLIQKHILAIQPLASPYTVIGANVTTPDQNVSVADLLRLRQVILGIYNDFPGVPSWRFIPADIVLDPNMPYNPPYAEHCKTVTVAGNTTGVNFIGVKSGDANGNAVGD